MSDEQRIQELLDRKGISAYGERELNYLEQELGVSPEEIQAATTAVGHDPERVERYLRDRTGR